MRIDWSKAPEGEYYQGSWKTPFCDKWITIATREPERKTVEDAVEALEGACWFGLDVFCSYSTKEDKFFTHTSRYQGEECEYIVCTREEFEACAAAKTAKSEPEWTHRLDGRRCKIILDKPDIDEDIVVLCEDGDYKIVGFEVLKPIKPKITKAQAWDLFTKHFWSAANILDKHEVIE